MKVKEEEKPKLHPVDESTRAWNEATVAERRADPMEMANANWARADEGIGAAADWRAANILLNQVRVINFNLAI